jgi:hypothetical protein
MFGIKDKIASSGLKKVINGYLTGIGEVEKIDLDQKNKKIFVSVNLNGEDKPLTVSINKYELIRKGNSLFVRIVDVSASKEWLESAVKKYGGDSIPVPDQYADIVEKIL